ncbi:immune inhibitor A peptidase M6-domain-containing protein [Clohesyomyces aquaticus]|uniref:Immune inhibitor A peptidase M6-domain-containing protein n=1 Tax=Clohesyomyces aquaticus TaxID=1231657 RepID=A0A1Y1ZZ32_9PLEO|nr:immune inhibitor A peptidase M6-domain-containing protein [Clohesyomyces aquaticus]
MAPRHSDAPCWVAPHPDALIRHRREIMKLQGTANEASLETLTHSLTMGHGKIPGLNDGTIFPKSHFDKPVTAMAMSNAGLERTPLSGAIRVAVVLVDFQDVKMGAGAKQRFEDLLFSTGKVPTGSVSEYYQEVSRGKISLTGEVVGPFTLSQNLAYYANNNYGREWPAPNSTTMADEALTAADGSINLKPYDNDGNGYVDAFVVVHAGTGAEQTLNKNDIWSVKWTLPNERQVNGVKVYGFLTVPEDAKCGVCAHEFGHLLFGWPDLYDIDNSSWGIGNWCLMSFGSWGGGGDRPVHPSAWCKQNQQWIDVVNETENHRITLEDVKASHKTHRLWKNGDSASHEYYLIENRQLTGYDESLPGAGLLIWHIDDDIYTNADENHPKVKIMQADGLDQLNIRSGWAGDAGDPFPGIANNSTFNSISNPNSKAYSGQDTFVSVTNIPQPSPSMTFDITVKPVGQPGTPFNDKTWYRLENPYKGPGVPVPYALDVINDGAGNIEGRIQMAREANVSGQFWQIIPHPDSTYALRTMFLGPNRQLDVYGNDKTLPHLAQAGNYSGQIWSIKPWGDGTWHLENAYSGPNLYLDTMEGGSRVALNQSNVGRPTQRWTISAIRPITEPGF